MRVEIKNSTDVSPETKQTHLNTLNKLIEYKKNSEISFADIDYSFVDGFLNFLRNKNHAQNTVHKELKNFKKYVGIAMKKGHYDKANPCKDFKVRFEIKKREVLTLDEIKKIEELDLSKYDEKVNEARDNVPLS